MGFEEQYDMRVEIRGAVCMAFGFSLPLKGHREDFRSLMKTIVSERGEYLENIAKSRSV